MTNIIQMTASADEVAAVVMTLEPALIDVPRATAIMALLTVTVVLMRPDVSPEQLASGVLGASRWLCLHLDDEPGEDPEKVTLN